MKAHILLLVAIASAPVLALADAVNVTGNIVTSGGNIVAQSGNVTAQNNLIAVTGYVKAQTYFYTPGWLQADNYVQGNNYVKSPGYIEAGSRFYSASGYLQVGGYVQAAGSGYFGDCLRVGGATNQPAPKSVQIGPNATASSYCSLVVGQHNMIEGTAGSWNGTPGAKEPLLVVANGVDANNKNNAFTVYKDGTVTMSKAQGDILMGQFGN